MTNYSTLYTVNDLVEKIINQVEERLHHVKKQEEEQKPLPRYDTKMDYSMGFWDGFFYGASLISGIMIGAIYYFK